MKKIEQHIFSHRTQCSEEGFMSRVWMIKVLKPTKLHTAGTDSKPHTAGTRAQNFVQPLVSTPSPNRPPAYHCWRRTPCAGEPHTAPPFCCLPAGD